jgi:hypothetical protein
LACSQLPDSFIGEGVSRDPSLASPRCLVAVVTLFSRCGISDN